MTASKCFKNNFSQNYIYISLS